MRIKKVYFPDTCPHDGLPKYPWVFLPYLPIVGGVFFDSWHGTVGYGIVPFALTTRAMLSDTQFLLEVYEDELVYEE